MTDKGVVVDVEGQSERIYFECALILGDNHGLNCICGFSEGFRTRYFCLNLFSNIVANPKNDS